MSYINLFSALTLLIIIQKCLSQVAVIEEKSPGIIHDNFYKAMLSVKEAKLHNEHKKLVGNKAYYDEKIKLMKKHNNQFARIAAEYKNRIGDLIKDIVVKKDEVKKHVIDAQDSFDGSDILGHSNNQTATNS
ncbi:Hypothetical protein SRAE_2000055900 [Strongyloides ratti]|uniref:DUF148 domain-containing protein n=1 Tax=Strongyloides ratti TaxID=34506 RepID=A0A090MXR3_STRRB|nr:Hypothetical protein SRAE_2000055900 [Strongyloides ratti]CEF65884.1 Hypothetical protein SRAE_2000055900 [Strongyloides ratti]